MNFQISIRWIIFFLSMYSCALLFAQRAALSVAIVAMTRGINSESNNNEDYYCANRKNQTNSNNQSNAMSDANASSSSFSSMKKTFINFLHFDLNATNNRNQSSQRLTEKLTTIGGEFDWDEKLQGVILGSSFYIFSIVPTFAGRFTDSLGAKWITFIGVLFPCLLTAAIPISVRTFDAPAAIVIQTIVGAFHGCIYPSIFSLSIKWFPARERATVGAGMIGGGAFGNSLMYAITGYLCESSIGWPLVFYTMAALHVPFLLMWPYFVTSDPFDSKRLSDRELIYIKTNVPRSTAAANGREKKRKLNVPWCRILASPLVWGNVAAKCANAFGYFLLLAKMPSFLHMIYGVPIMQNGTFSAIATSSTGISSLLAPSLATFMIDRLGMRSIVVRKIIQATAMIGPVISLCLITVFECDLFATLVCIFVAMFFYGMLTGGEFPLVTAFAPNLAGTVVGILLLIPYATGILGPYIVGLILDQGAGSFNDRWNLIFYITAAAFAFGATCFVTLADDRQQEWDKAAVADDDHNVKSDQDDFDNNNNNFSSCEVVKP